MPGTKYAPVLSSPVGRLLRLRLGGLQIRLESPRLFAASRFLDRSWMGRQPETEQPAYSWGRSWMGRQPETEQPADTARQVMNMVVKVN